ncbi:MAG: VOC family protein [Dehalococcoidia bacterium]
MSEAPKYPLFVKVDCYQLSVNDLDAALRFYRDALGHELVWRSETAAGLRMPGGDSELVLQTERPEAETDLLVESVGEAVERFVVAGGRLIRGPFEIQIGLCAVVMDPFANVLVMLDMSKGRLVTDAEGRIVGNEGAEPSG